MNTMLNTQSQEYYSILHYNKARMHVCKLILHKHVFISYIYKNLFILLI